MAVLVTGGAGYIGSNICVELLNAGEEIVVVDNFSNSKPSAIDDIKKITGKDFFSYTMDLRDRNALVRVMSENKIESVIHLAALKSVSESIASPIEYYNNNLLGVLVLCEIMEKFEIKNFVFSSSATVYGTSEDVPYSEDSPLSTTNPYGATKHMTERILSDWQNADEQRSITLLRYFNPVGAHESGLLGEDPEGVPANLVPYIMGVITGDYPFIKITGDDFDTPDGTGVRDYIHIKDLSRGHLKALEHNRAHRGTEAFNLGTGKGYSVKEMIATFEEILGEEIPKKIMARRPGDIATSYANTGKAKKVLGFEAKKSLEDMCRDSLKFIGK